MTKTIKDCVIIGAGPAGLTAGIYLRRYRRNIEIFDNARSRAALIPISHNYPGIAEGIAGTQLLKNLRQQLIHYATEVTCSTVTSAIKDKQENFIITSDTKEVIARTLILATGVVDIEPELPNLTNAIGGGLIRHCPICDGYEIIDQKIGVIGFGTKGLKEALFLRAYSSNITLLTLGHPLNKSEMLALKNANIIPVLEPVESVKIENNKVIAFCVAGKTVSFDTLYSALGVTYRSELALQLGAQHFETGCITTDAHQQTSIAGLYAIGDVTTGLNQICVATGQAAIAATHIHNLLCRPY